jgi:uncharacterized protein YkwD
MLRTTLPRLALASALSLVTAWPGPVRAQDAIAAAQRRADAAELLRLLNAYRVQRGLHAVPVSPSLTQVAEAHVADLERNPPAGMCSGHSWSPSRQWKACCYTDDHAKAACMWEKPREITAGAYPGYGYEMWAWRSGRMTLEFALEGWKNSPPHHEMLASLGPWKAQPWLAMGVAVSQHHAVVWFGTDPDPAAGR